MEYAGGTEACEKAAAQRGGRGGRWSSAEGKRRGDPGVRKVRAEFVNRIDEARLSRPSESPTA